MISRIGDERTRQRHIPHLQRRKDRAESCRRIPVIVLFFSIWRQRAARRASNRKRIMRQRPQSGSRTFSRTIARASGVGSWNTTDSDALSGKDIRPRDARGGRCPSFAEAARDDPLQRGRLAAAGGPTARRTRPCGRKVNRTSAMNTIVIGLVTREGDSRGPRRWEVARQDSFQFIYCVGRSSTPTELWTKRSG